MRLLTLLKAVQQELDPSALSPSAPGSGQYLLDAFHRGLGESGYVDGQNVRIDHRLAAGRFDRFPEMAADLGLRHCIQLSMECLILTMRSESSADEESIRRVVGS